MAVAGQTGQTGEVTGMGVGDALSIHVEFELRVMFTIVIALGLCVAGWRYLRRASRRRTGDRDGNPRDTDAP
jgi:hypothetical protein